MLANFATLDEVEQAMLPGKLQIVDDQGESPYIRRMIWSYWGVPWSWAVVTPKPTAVLCGRPAVQALP